MPNKNEEFERFDDTMRRLMQVPHSQLQEKLQKEKNQKQQKRKAKKPSASGRESDAKT